ncbi:MAG: CoA transferase [Deltaproteobacteria bacterium]|nr:CoA transferase [Deltaproteobacteria bacterium]MBW2385493.1 CoA transferase [Deltaproteobacteria bacterium]
MPDSNSPGPLHDIRVLDLATPLGEATGRVLADLGAEVLKIEPPGGCASRFTAPFEDGREGDPEGSLFWRAWGMGKRSAVLDLEDAGDRERLLALIDGADILVESSRPGEMARLGLDAETLGKRNPALVYVSVTPFGQTGPFALHPATDLTLSGAGGLMDCQGDGDRVPLPIGHPEASCHGAVQAAADALLALYGRERDGRGQHLDSSMQAAIVWTLLMATGYAAMMGEDKPSAGEMRGVPQEMLPGLRIPDRTRVADGFVVMTPVLGEVGQRSLTSMMKWAGEQGALDDDLIGLDFGNFIGLLTEGKLTPADIQRGFDQLVAFLGTRTKGEIQQRANDGAWLIGPASTTEDLLADKQLASRHYWTDVGGTRHPGPFARLSRTPIQYRSAAPKLGADQSLVDDVSRKPSAPAKLVSEPRASLLEGLKVADFSWVGAGPLTSKDLANLGASVVHVESEKHIDPLRFIPPWKDGVPNVSTGHAAANFNQSKLGLGLDLATDAGREVAYRLVDWADIVIESFTPGTAAKLGLDYETLRQRKPDIVMLSSCMRGQTGPEAHYTGFGLQGAGLAGFVAITGWPDRLPSGPWGAYTDFISPRFSVAAVAAALHHRDRTGEGQYIDLSQIEAALHYLEPMVLDYTVNGHIAGLQGLESQRACPHGVFAAQGKHRYLAVAVESPQQWAALQELVPGLAAIGDCDELGARLARKLDLEKILAEWCAERDAFECAKLLREVDVPAYVSLRGTDLLRDVQLAHRGFFVELEHSAIGPTLYDGSVTQFSRTPAAPTHAGPPIGEHSFQVLSELLGYDADEIADLAAAQALT